MGTKKRSNPARLLLTGMMALTVTLTVTLTLTLTLTLTQGYGEILAGCKCRVHTRRCLQAVDAGAPVWLWLAPSTTSQR